MAHGRAHCRARIRLRFSEIIRQSYLRLGMRELGTWILQGCACTTPRIKRGLGLYRLACLAKDANFDRMLHPIVELTDSPSGPVRHVNLEQRINNKNELTM